MSSMVERVARALCEECALEPFDRLSRSKYMADARTVLKAMREPTQPMIDRGYATGPSDTTWRNMIDAALSESEGT